MQDQSRGKSQGGKWRTKIHEVVYAGPEYAELEIAGPRTNGWPCQKLKNALNDCWQKDVILKHPTYKRCWVLTRNRHNVTASVSRLDAVDVDKW